VTGYPRDVLHQLNRCPEDVCIDALEDVADTQQTRLIIARAKRVVDVTRAIRDPVHEVGTHVEKGGNFSEIRQDSNGGHGSWNSLRLSRDN
jgi:hypothetical protein